jgi:hypothetical protein
MKMLTGYWSVDVFILANVALCVVVMLVYGYYQITGGGMLCDHPDDNNQRSKS